MSTLAVSQVLIVQGDTGCGKTTQIPQFILQEFPTSRVVVTQPRRLAAIGVAKRVSEELGCSLGDVVGYHIKGEKLYGDSSRVVFMTTGMFIQELVGSSEFPWTHVIVDEVHERAVETEFLLVILKHILARKDSKLILMSATIDTNLFANYYADSEIRAVGTSLPWFEISENVKFDTSLNSFEEV
jgi:HrpA-like RNA helicase